MSYKEFSKKNKTAFFILAVMGTVFFVLFFSFFDRGQDARALTTSESNTKIKTLAFSVFQSQAVTASGSSVSGDVTVFVGEQGPIIKNAYIEIEGVSKSVAAQTITADIKQSTDTFPTARTRSFILNSSGKDNPFTVRYGGNDSTGNNLANYLASIITAPSPYTFNIKIDVSGANVSLLKAKLVITYQFTPPASGGTVPNSATGVYHALQSRGILLNTTSTTTDLSVQIGDPNPVIKNAYLLVEGVSNPTASQTVTIDIKQPADSFPTARAQSFVLNTTGKNGVFSILYSGSAGNNLASYLAGIITTPSEYIFNIKIDANGADVSLLHVRLVVMYQFTQAAGGGFPPTGSLISPTFDTYASNGATYNSIIWKGTKPLGTRVKLQLATSDISTGPFSFVGGATCTGADYYEPASDTMAELKCFSSFNNKRYFRYKVTLDSNVAQDATPQVDDVMVNWSP